MASIFSLWEESLFTNQFEFVDVKESGVKKKKIKLKSTNKLVKKGKLSRE
jgi:hypothetical protein